MITNDQLTNLLSSGAGNVVGASGEKIGKVGQVFLDDQTGQPEWVTAKTGLFGGAESFIPLAQATLAGSDMTVPYGKDMVKGAPRVSDADGHLSQAEEAELYRYYGLDYSEATSDSGLATGQAAARTTPAAARDDASIVRSEERLNVGTQKVQTGRARLRKFIVAEQQTVTVPVTREQAKVVHEPITAENIDRSLDGPEITEAVHEVTLTEDRVVVNKEAVPVERIRLDKQTVTEQQQVSETVRKEQVEMDTVDVTNTQTTSAAGLKDKVAAAVDDVKDRAGR
jgi:uncharacterized protein (TIGR02271 family)